MLFAIIYVYKFVVHQMDVKIVFLNNEEIYIELHEGLVILNKKFKVYEMVKSLHLVCTYVVMKPYFYFH
jgi:hypothetical protein